METKVKSVVNGFRTEEITGTINAIMENPEISAPVRNGTTYRFKTVPPRM